MTTGGDGTPPSGGLTGIGRAEYVWRLLIAALIVVMLVVAWLLLDLLLLLFGAVLMAVLLQAVAEVLSARTRLPPRWSLVLTVLGLAAILVSVGWAFGTEVRTQMEGLSSRLGEAWRPLEARIAANATGREVLRSIEAAIIGPTGAGYVTRAAVLLTNAIAGFILVVVGGIYLAAQPKLYRKGVLLLFPRAFRAEAGHTLDLSARALRHWLLGQLAIMLIVGTLTGLGAWLIGLPSALALGIIAAVLEFIPYLGPILTAVPAVLLGLAIGPETALASLGLVFVVQQLEGYVITPLVQREAVTLPPALTLFALLATGLLFGPLGLLFSAPLTVVAYVAVGELYVRRTLGEDIEPLQELARPVDDGG
jgi:predicted PurR-regulated permease PerM